MQKLLFGIVFGVVGGVGCLMMAALPQSAHGMMDLMVQAERFTISFGGEFSAGPFVVDHTTRKTVRGCVDADGDTVACTATGAIPLYNYPKHEDFDFRIGAASLAVRATSELNADLTVGGEINLELGADAGSIDVDELYLFVEGNFGSLQLGGNDAPSEDMYVGPPWIGANGPDDPSYYFNARSSARLSSEADTTGDASKLIYYSPELNFIPMLGASTFGISYTPRLDLGDDPAFLGAEGAPARRDAGDFSHIISLGVAQNSGELIPDVEINAYFGYETAKAHDSKGDLLVLATGASASWKGFEVGGTFYHGQNVEGADKDQVWTIGGAYSQDDWTIGASYRASQRTLDENPGVKQKNETIYFAIAYDLIKGFTVTWMLNYTKDFNPNDPDPTTESIASGVVMSYAF